jgi:hypothetical protein
VDRAELDRLTRLLCYLCGKMRDTNEFRTALLENRELSHWWGLHLAEDARRAEEDERERRFATAKAAALAKLTPEEREALGL